jgi:TRAP-type mannitol/chloroaromatic compound transport system permease small subunit
MGEGKDAGTVGNVIRVVENILNVIAGVMLLAMMFLGAADVIGRYVFNSPITGAMESSQLLMGGMVFLAWAYTLAKREHVTVDILFITYPKRVRATLYFFMMIITFVLFALVFWQSLSMAISDWQAGKLVRIILIPIAPFKALVPLGALLLCLECIIQIIQTAPVMIRGKED